MAFRDLEYLVAAIQGIAKLSTVICPHCGAKQPVVVDAFCNECRCDLSERPGEPMEVAAALPPSGDVTTLSSNSRFSTFARVCGIAAIVICNLFYFRTFQSFDHFREQSEENGFLGRLIGSVLFGSAIWGLIGLYLGQFFYGMFRPYISYLRYRDGAE